MLEKEGGGGSMFEKLNNHEERIIILEKTDVELIKQIKDIQNNYVTLENTILKGNQTTQEVFRDTIDKQWQLITERDKVKEESSKRQHELAISNHEYKKSNMEKKWEWLGKIGVAGGVLYLVIERFFPI